MILAHHPLVTALPLVIPAVVMALLLVGVVIRDRRMPDDPEETEDGRAPDPTLRAGSLVA